MKDDTGNSKKKKSNGKKKMSLGEVENRRPCWEWELGYQWIDEDNPEIFHMDPYFIIDVDLDTGEILANFNNYR